VNFVNSVTKIESFLDLRPQHWEPGMGLNNSNLDVLGWIWNVYKSF